jgi:glycosyltransferase 2 family protein
LSTPPRDRAVVVGALAVFVGGAWAARRPGVTHVEARCFEAVNRLSHRAFVPVWTVMQLGSLGGALATGAAVRAVGRRRLATQVAAVGSVTWLGAKAVKPFVRRGRPALTVEDARVLGRAQSGLGYPSGHAAVTAAMAAVASPHLPRRWRTGAWLTALAVGGARVYVGAHLPLDVVGGTALGLAIGTAGRRPGRRPPRSRRPRDRA